jgi:hypothetical protein
MQAVPVAFILKSANKYLGGGFYERKIYTGSLGLTEVCWH